MSLPDLIKGRLSLNILASWLPFLIFLIGPGVCAGQSQRVSIAANLPLSGELATYGVSIKRGMLLAVESLDEKLKERIQIDWQDNRGSNKEAYTIMNGQLAGQPDIYVSGLKPQTMTITDQISKAGIPHFTWILDVLINPKSENNLRAWVSFKLEADAYLKAVKGRDIKRVAMLYVHLPAAELQFREILAPAFKRQGAQEVWIENYPMDSGDFKSLALRVKAFNPDLIVLNGFIPHIVSLVRELRYLKLIKDGNTLVSLDMLEAAQQLTPEQLEGIIVAAPDYLTNSNEGKSQTWRQLFQNTFGSEPNYHSAFAYDMVLSIAAAAEVLPAAASHQEWLKALRAVAVDGITGRIEFDADGSSKTVMNPAIYRSGKLKLLEGDG